MSIILVFVAAVVGITATGLAAGSRALLHVGLGVWERVGIWPQAAWPQAAWPAVAGVGTAWAAVARKGSAVAGTS
ncbi:hypothetical protein [Streptomyces shenzhenensis]|uniref:hypothetical protein n=1 Tax=Streptomyces shenzhenensis TaxID=943815 RepID=UPI0015F121FA|nr:hypothetical protein [Streptomyces shenzhenensis]